MTREQPFPLRVETGGKWYWLTLIRGDDARLNWVAKRETLDASGLIGFGDNREDWRVGAFDGEEGYPVGVSFFQQRLCFAGTPRKPLTVWQSVLQDFENFSPSAHNRGITEAHAKTYSLASSRISKTLWMLPHGDSLFLGSTDAVHQLIPERSFNPNSLSVPTIKEVSRLPCENVPPVSVGQTLFFLERGGTRLRAISPNNTGEIEEPREVSLLAEHLLTSEVREMAFAHRPYSALFCVLKNGGLASLTFNQNEGIFAWAEHRLAGNAKVESLCVVPAPTYDQVWLCLRRRVGGTTQRSLVMMDASALFHLDLAVKRTLRDNVITGLEAFEGQTVVVLDTTRHQEVARLQVARAKITLPSPHTGEVWVGLPFSSQLTTLPLARQEGPGEWQRIHHLTLNVQHSAGTLHAGQKGSHQP